MKKLLETTDLYGKTMNWQRFSLFKVCCISFGVVLGASMGGKTKNQGLVLASLVFAFTYIIAMLDFLGFIYRKEEPQETE